jgi:Acetyl-coenzyme A transporter 1
MLCANAKSEAAAMQDARAAVPESGVNSHAAKNYTHHLSMLVQILLMCNIACRDPGTGEEMSAACPRNAQAAQQASESNLCHGAGGHCAIVRDGFYGTNLLMIALGVGLFFHFRRALPALESLPLDAWRGKPPRRHA